jgi:hypothetical protein
LQLDDGDVAGSALLIAGYPFHRATMTGQTAS